MTDWRALREATGLTRREAATLAGLNPTTLRLLETGRKRATLGVAARLARFYRDAARERRR